MTEGEHTSFEYDVYTQFQSALYRVYGLVYMVPCRKLGSIRPYSEACHRKRQFKKGGFINAGTSNAIFENDNADGTENLP